MHEINRHSKTRWRAWKNSNTQGNAQKNGYCKFRSGRNLRRRKQNYSDKVPACLQLLRKWGWNLFIQGQKNLRHLPWWNQKYKLISFSQQLCFKVKIQLIILFLIRSFTFCSQYIYIEVVYGALQSTKCVLLRLQILNSKVQIIDPNRSICSTYWNHLAN